MAREDPNREIRPGQEVDLSEGKSMSFPPSVAYVSLTVGGMPSPPPPTATPIVVVQSDAAPAQAPPPSPSQASSE